MNMTLSGAENMRYVDRLFVGEAMFVRDFMWALMSLCGWQKRSWSSAME